MNSTALDNLGQASRTFQFTSVDVLVLDENRNPIPDSSVVVGVAEKEYVAKTDAKGFAALSVPTVVARAGPARVAAAAPGFEAALKKIDAPTAPTTEFQLKKKSSGLWAAALPFGLAAIVGYAIVKSMR